jgi:hypothetical protein
MLRDPLTYIVVVGILATIFFVTVVVLLKG